MNVLDPHTIERMAEVIKLITDRKVLVKLVHTFIPMGERNRKKWSDIELMSSNRKNAKVVLVITYDVYSRFKFDIKSAMNGDLYAKNIAAYKKYLSIKNRGSKLEKLGIA